jgi:predicted TIM-barrel fold metal-dependent hydrolase
VPNKISMTKENEDVWIKSTCSGCYGYAPATEEVKRKIFGENLARLLKIEPKMKV